jgi:hypothetical protein
MRRSTRETSAHAALQHEHGGPAALFPALGDMGRRWHCVLVELPQQRSDPVQQRLRPGAATIGECSIGRTAKERRAVVSA